MDWILNLFNELVQAIVAPINELMGGATNVLLGSPLDINLNPFAYDPVAPPVDGLFVGLPNWLDGALSSGVAYSVMVFSSISFIAFLVVGWFVATKDHLKTVSWLAFTRLPEFIRVVLAAIFWIVASMFALFVAIGVFLGIPVTLGTLASYVYSAPMGVLVSILLFVGSIFGAVALGKKLLAARSTGTTPALEQVSPPSA